MCCEGPAPSAFIREGMEQKISSFNIIVLECQE